MENPCPCITFLTLNKEKPYKCTYCIGEECQMEQKCTFGHDEKKTMTWQIRGGEYSLYFRTASSYLVNYSWDQLISKLFFLHWKPKPCKSIITGKNLFVLQETPVLITGSLFSLQGFPCKCLYFPFIDCSASCGFISQGDFLYVDLFSCKHFL